MNKVRDQKVKSKKVRSNKVKFIKSETKKSNSESQRSKSQRPKSQIHKVRSSKVKKYSDLVTGSMATWSRQRLTPALNIERMSFCVFKVRFVRLSLVCLRPGGP